MCLALRNLGDKVEEIKFGGVGLGRRNVGISRLGLTSQDAPLTEKGGPHECLVPRHARPDQASPSRNAAFFSATVPPHLRPRRLAPPRLHSSLLAWRQVLSSRSAGQPRPTAQLSRGVPRLAPRASGLLSLAPARSRLFPADAARGPPPAAGQGAPLDSAPQRPAPEFGACTLIGPRENRRAQALAQRPDGEGAGRRRLRFP